MPAPATKPPERLSRVSVLPSSASLQTGSSTHEFRGTKKKFGSHIWMAEAPLHMINKILVATDGSESSNRAVELAADLANVHNASLHAINVIRQIQIPPDMQTMARVESLGENRLSVLEFIANQILDDAESQVQAKGASLAKKSIGHEDPATSISKYAVKHGMDLVIVGSRGLNKVESLLMGSVSRKVAEICKVNCLIVR